MDEFERIARESATVEKALAELDDAGARPIQGIKALMQGRGLPLEVAKAAVCKSSAWAEWDLAQETLADELENMDF